MMGKNSDTESETPTIGVIGVSYTSFEPRCGGGNHKPQWNAVKEGSYMAKTHMTLLGS
jgi:hypothetical protein